MEKTLNIATKKRKETLSRRVFLIVNGVILSLFAIACIIPFVNLLAISFSSKSSVIAGDVWLVPIGFNLNSYKYLLQQSDFFRAFGYSVVRVILGTVISICVTVLMAYPLAFEAKALKGHRAYLLLIIVSMFFSGGLIPTFIIISNLGLYNTMWALVLPTAMNCWNLILLINFFRGIPKDLIESAHIEGADDFKVLTSIVIPVSMPVIATVTLFCIIGHWNNWFDGYIYMSKEKWPLQTYIYDIMETLKNFQLNMDKLSPQELEMLANSNDATLRAAQIFIAMVPILCVYPFAQKYFVKGILLGSVKG